MVPIHLPRPGQALRHRESKGHLPVHSGSFTREAWARPNEAHISFQDVDELRELIQERCPQPASQWRHPGIDPAFEQGPIGLVQVEDFIRASISAVNHGPKFVEDEWSLAERKTVLLIKNRSGP